MEERIPVRYGYKLEERSIGERTLWHHFLLGYDGILATYGEQSVPSNQVPSNLRIREDASTENFPGDYIQLWH